MATFNHKDFINYDDYMTPRHVWEDIKDILNRHLEFTFGSRLYRIWEPFYGDGTSGKNLESIADPLAPYHVLHDPVDFFKVPTSDEYNKLGIGFKDSNQPTIVSNPPFSIKKKVFQRLKEHGLPFIIVCPVSTMNTQYFRKLFKNEIKIIVPKKRIQFIKIDKEGNPIKTSGCNFDCYYYCWKIKGLKNDITWL